MLETLQRLVDFHTAWPARDAVLRVGTTGVVLLYYLAAVVICLRDGTAAGSAQQPGWDPGSGEASEVGVGPTRPRLGLVLSFGLLALVGVYPWLFARDWHWWLLAAGVAMGFAATAESRVPRLRLRAPQRLGRRDLLFLCALELVALATFVTRWHEIPPALGEDEARFILNGLRIWTQNDHPFHINESLLPAVPDIFHGLFLMFTGPEAARVGLRLYPIFCSLLALPVVYRWSELLGSRRLAVPTCLVLLALPSFQYYARVPTGNDLLFQQVLFLWAMTRCLVSPGAGAWWIGGFALGLAQWNYHPSRMLVLYLLSLSAAALLFRRQFGRGWLRRLLLLGIVALPLTLALRLARGYDPATWTWYLTPGVLSIKGLSSGLLESTTEWALRAENHARMWFDSTRNLGWVITLPGSSVLPWPLGPLGLLGAGLLVRSLTRFAAWLVGGMFLIGILPSFLASASPSTHRILLSEVPAATLVALTITLLLPAGGAAGRITAGRLRWGLAVLLTAWVMVAGLSYFHRDLWRDPRAWHAGHNIEQTLRIERILRDAPRFEVHGHAPFGAEHFYLGLHKIRLLPYDLAQWLPPNGSPRPLAVHAVTRQLALVGFVRTAFPPASFDEPFDPVGHPAGWGYRTDAIRLGSAEVADQWNRQRSVTGSIFFPKTEVVEIRCPGYRIAYESPFGRSVVMDRGRILVYQGLATVELHEGSTPATAPERIAIQSSRGAGAGETRSLAVEDLFSLPVRGWLRGMRTQPAGSGSPFQVSYATLPVIYSSASFSELNLGRGQQRQFTYSATVNVPPGRHSVRFTTHPARRFQVLLDGVEEQPWDDIRSLVDFELDAERHNGRRIEIDVLELDEPSEHQLILLRDGRTEVPPYDWFRPAEPSRSLESAPWLSARGRVEIRLRQAASQVYVTELAPLKVEHGFAPPRPNATWQGEPIQMGGVTYLRGLGMHSWCRVTYAVPDGATHFQAIIGLSDHVRASGMPEVTFELRDEEDRLLFDSGTIDRRSQPEAVLVDVAAAKSVTLVVTMGSNGGAHDHANWAEAAFLIGSLRP
jgi:hypothetical protein